MKAGDHPEPPPAKILSELGEDSKRHTRKLDEIDGKIDDMVEQGVNAKIDQAAEKVAARVESLLEEREGS